MGASVSDLGIVLRSCWRAMAGGRASQAFCAGVDLKEFAAQRPG